MTLAEGNLLAKVEQRWNTETKKYEYKLIEGETQYVFCVEHIDSFRSGSFTTIKVLLGVIK